MTSGAEEFFTLARDLGKAPVKLAAALYDVYKDEGEQFAKEWADNARETSGQHASRYPSSITSETHAALGIEVVTGPEDSPSNQGFLGRVLEFGGQHSPPHLDGARALPAAEERLGRAADLAVAYVVP